MSAKKLYDELQAIKNDAVKYINVAKEQGVSDGDYVVEWSTAYTLIFSKEISHRAYEIFEKLGINFDYYDPDTSYQEDVTAYVDALKEEVDKLKPFFT